MCAQDGGNCRHYFLFSLASPTRVLERKRRTETPPEIKTKIEKKMTVIIKWPPFFLFLATPHVFLRGREKQKPPPEIKEKVK